MIIHIYIILLIMHVLNLSLLCKYDLLFDRLVSFLLHLHPLIFLGLHNLSRRSEMLEMILKYGKPFHSLFLEFGGGY